MLIHSLLQKTMSKKKTTLLGILNEQFQLPPNTPSRVPLGGDGSVGFLDGAEFPTNSFGKVNVELSETGGVLTIDLAIEDKDMVRVIVNKDRSVNIQPRATSLR